MNGKVIIGITASVIWLAAIVAKHFWDDIDISGIVAAAGSALSGIGVYHIQDAKAAAADKVLLPTSTSTTN